MRLVTSALLVCLVFFTPALVATEGSGQEGSGVEGSGVEGSGVEGSGSELGSGVDGIQEIIDEIVDALDENDVEIEDFIDVSQVPEEQLVEKVVQMVKTFTDITWNNDFANTQSTAYQNLVVDLKDKIFDFLSGNSKFLVSKDSIKIISVSQSSATGSTNTGRRRRRRRNVNAGNVIVDYEVIARYNPTTVSQNDLAAAVAIAAGVPVTALTITSVPAGATSLAMSVVMMLASVMMFYL